MLRRVSPTSPLSASWLSEYNQHGQAIDGEKLIVGGKNDSSKSQMEDWENNQRTRGYINHETLGSQKGEKGISLLPN